MTVNASFPPKKFPKLAMIGGGQMARALTGGLLDQSIVEPAGLTVVDPSDDSQRWWADHHPAITCVADVAMLPSDVAVVVLAVKPNIIPAVLKGPAETWSGKLILSIAAGVSLQQLTNGVGHRRVVRVMPNTPCLVGEGASGYCTAADVTAGDEAIVQRMLGSVGVCVRVTESQIDAVTGVSGSGPAYVFVMIEALADGGVAAGLPRDVALKLATQTVLGAAMLARETGQHPAQLKDNVCSPGGTTIAAIAVLEQNGVRGAIIDAVRAAAARSGELGRG